ncbi:MAG: hypothetical protein WDM92_00265 [Caulobacteraceae bacterium]
MARPVTASIEETANQLYSGAPKQALSTTHHRAELLPAAVHRRADQTPGSPPPTPTSWPAASGCARARSS